MASPICLWGRFIKNCTHDLSIFRWHGYFKGDAVRFFINKGGEKIIFLLDRFFFCHLSSFPRLTLDSFTCSSRSKLLRNRKSESGGTVTVVKLLIDYVHPVIRCCKLTLLCS